MMVDFHPRSASPQAASPTFGNRSPIVGTRRLTISTTASNSGRCFIKSNLPHDGLDGTVTVANGSPVQETTASPVTRSPGSGTFLPPIGRINANRITVESESPNSRANSPSRSVHHRCIDDRRPLTPTSAASVHHSQFEQSPRFFADKMLQPADRMIQSLSTDNSGKHVRSSPAVVSAMESLRLADNLMARSPASSHRLLDAISTTGTSSSANLSLLSAGISTASRADLSSSQGGYSTASAMSPAHGLHYLRPSQSPSPSEHVKSGNRGSRSRPTDQDMLAGSADQTRQNGYLFSFASNCPSPSAGDSIPPSPDMHVVGARPGRSSRSLVRRRAGDSFPSTDQAVIPAAAVPLRSSVSMMVTASTGVHPSPIVHSATSPALSVHSPKQRSAREQLSTMQRQPPALNVFDLSPPGSPSLCTMVMPPEPSAACPRPASSELHGRQLDLNGLVCTNANTGPVISAAAALRTDSVGASLTSSNSRNVHSHMFQSDDGMSVTQWANLLSSYRASCT